MPGFGLDQEAGFLRKRKARFFVVGRRGIVETSGLDLDMSVSVLLRLLEAAGDDLKFVAHHGHRRTLEDILAEQRSPDANP
ncbi:hypothetical protein BX591_101264 [Paraburkholderia bryophila]|uniref:Uncharacterized protein n=1 Tax=Paraburkholderia bryophila TaxID=420952 RepID=A0A329D3P0_9BURK|nr:hypothetical protein BX591_101264 [Paraburkholderia bryophila]